MKAGQYRSFVASAFILNRKSFAVQIPTQSRRIASSRSESRMSSSERTEGRRTPDPQGASWSSMNQKDRKVLASWAIAFATFYAFAAVGLLVLLMHGRQAPVAADSSRSAGAPLQEKALSLR
jgi:hypothetical protein